jgi:hypothetical protein
MLRLGAFIVIAAFFRCNFFQTLTRGEKPSMPVMLTSLIKTRAVPAWSRLDIFTLFQHLSYENKLSFHSRDSADALIYQK